MNYAYYLSCMINEPNQIDAIKQREQLERDALRQEILIYLFENTLPQAIDIAVKNYRFHALYQNKANHIVHTYFGGHRLHYAVFMADMFNQYLTPDQELRCEWILQRMTQLKRTIRYARKFRENCEAEVLEHNTLSDEYNRLMKGVNAFVKAYNSYRNKAKKK